MKKIIETREHLINENVGEKANILIVDDESKNVKLLKTLCESLGHDIKVAVNGKEAVEIALSSQPDLILMDVMMPVMDGFEATEKLKDNELTCKIPVIMVTALDSRKDRLKGISKGADDFLTKPIDLEEVSLRIKNNLNIKKYHDLLNDYNKILEDKVAERTEELSKKTRDLEQVLYAGSHDLKAPLVNAHGYSGELGISVNEIVSYLQSDEVPDSIRKKVASMAESIPGSIRFVQENILKMDLLLNGLMNISRLGRAEIREEEVDMNSLISDVIDTYGFRIREAGARMDVSDLLPCIGDPSQLSLVFANLIGNAINYLDSERRGEIKISGYQKDNRSGYCVEDNGIGIMPEHQEKIFEIFYRLEPHRLSGEGLGLTITRNILERMHGKIWVESEAGKGSRFFVSMPYIK